MEAKKIEVVKEWPKPKSVRDIQVFLGFANFYGQFIQGFSKIAALLTSMLKTTVSSQVLVTDKALDANEVGGIESGDKLIEKCGKLSKTGKTSKVQKLSKSRKSAKSKKPLKSENSPNFDAKDSGPSFLIPKTRTAFNRLRLAFTEAPILWHFDPECHIRIETNISGYAIDSVLRQLVSETRPDGVFTKTNLGQWHLVAFFSRKMISAKTRYETHDSELLAIVEAFKTWRYYLEGCKYEVLVFTDHNKLRHFMDTKSLSSWQVRWAQELFQYHFRIDYCQGKANTAADALSRFLQRSQDEEDKLRAENGQIFYRL